MGRNTACVAPLAWGDAQMAVLDTRVETNAVAAPAQRGVECRHDGVTLLVGRMAPGEVDHRVVLDGDQVASKRDLVGAEWHAHRRGLDRRPPGVELDRV